ncbi:MAG: hypothetical protein R6U63_03295 [Longimicrobiales bacterium]
MKSAVIVVAAAVTLMACTDPTEPYAGPLDFSAEVVTTNPWDVEVTVRNTGPDTVYLETDGCFLVARFLEGPDGPTVWPSGDAQPNCAAAIYFKTIAPGDSLTGAALVPPMATRETLSGERAYLELVASWDHEWTSARPDRAAGRDVVTDIGWVTLP